MVRVGINGFGRVGRLALRAGWAHPDLRFVHVNEPNADPATSAHLLTFDSVQGRWPHVASAASGSLVIDGRALGHSSHRSPSEVPWGDLGVEVVLECSGKFRTLAALAPYFEAAVRKVVVAAPVKDPAALNVVIGVNDHRYDPARHDIVTAASCTTNCLAPVVKVIHEETVREVNGLLRAAAEGPLHGILGYEERPLVSVDYRGDPRSSVVDALSTLVTDGTQVKVLAWYDNEWGYANRIVELSALVGGSLTPAP